MAYLNANIPVTYAQIRREYLYDLTRHHGEVEDCIIFGLSSITGRPILFHAIMENGAVFYRLPISAFIQRGFDAEEVPKRRLDELELWNCFSYFLLLLLGIFQTDKLANTQAKIKNGIAVNIYLLLILHIQRVIQLILTIQKFRTSISAHIYWHQMMAIMQHNLTTE